MNERRIRNEISFSIQSSEKQETRTHGYSYILIKVVVVVVGIVVSKYFLLASLPYYRVSTLTTSRDSVRCFNLHSSNRTVVLYTRHFSPSGNNILKRKLYFHKKIFTFNFYVFSVMQIIFLFYSIFINFFSVFLLKLEKKIYRFAVVSSIQLEKMTCSKSTKIRNSTFEKTKLKHY